MNNVIMRTITLTDQYQPLSSKTQEIGSVDVTAVPGNQGPVYFVCGDPLSQAGVAWISGEWHSFTRVNLAEIKVRGTVGDKVTVIGGTW